MTYIVLFGVFCFVNIYGPQIFDSFPFCHPHFLAVDQQLPGPLMKSRFFHQSLSMCFLSLEFLSGLICSNPAHSSRKSAFSSQAGVFCLWSLTLGTRAFEIIFLKPWHLVLSYFLKKSVTYENSEKVNIHYLSLEGCILVPEIPSMLNVMWDGLFLRQGFAVYLRLI